MHTTSLSLMEQLRSLDEVAAWERFVSIYSPMLFCWARRLGLNDQDAAELVQDVFVVIARRIGTFDYDPNRSFRSWLKTVAMNVFRAHLRKVRSRGLSIGFEQGVPLDELTAEQQAVDEQFWEQEYRHFLTREALRIVKRDFADKTWRACWELVVEGRPGPEIASELGMTVGAVYAARVRVLARLRDELAGLMD